MSDNTKASSPGRSENVAASPPPISYDPTTPLLGVGDHVACAVKDGVLSVFKVVTANGVIGLDYAQHQIAQWADNTGIPYNRVAAHVGRLAAWRMQHGAWRVFDPRVSALLPRIDAQLED